MIINNNTLIHKYLVPLVLNIDFNKCENNSNIKTVISNLMTIAKNTMNKEEEPGNTKDVEIDELKGAILLDKKNSKTDESKKAEPKKKPESKKDTEPSNDIKIEPDSDVKIKPSNDVKIESNNAVKIEPNSEWFRPLYRSENIKFKDYFANDNFLQVGNIDLDNEKSLTRKELIAICKESCLSLKGCSKYNKADLIKYMQKNGIKDLEKRGKKKRQTLIRFEPTAEFEKNYSKITEWLYLFTINSDNDDNNDDIIKIGGTRSGIKDRIGSYYCGHHTQDRGKSGYCSNTNAVIYNTFEFYVKNGHNIKIYGKPLLEVSIPVKPYINKETEAEGTVQTYHIFESIYLSDFKEKYNIYPILNYNCDPKYRKV